MTPPAPNPAKPHGFVTKGIHWISLLMIGYGYYKGLENVGQLADPALFRFEIIFASALGLLFAFRLFWTRKIGGTTRLPDHAPRWEHLASRAVHVGLYAAVFAIVGTGLAIALAYAQPLLGRFFMDTTIALHEAALAVLPLLIVTHIAGALWHKFARRDGVLETMTGPLPL